MLSEPGAPNTPQLLSEIFNRAAEPASQRAEARAVLHDLRDWAASTALLDGHAPVAVAAHLGHSPDSPLRIYTQGIEKGQVGAAPSMAARLDP